MTQLTKVVGISIDTYPDYASPPGLLIWLNSGPYRGGSPMPVNLYEYDHRGEVYYAETPEGFADLLAYQSPGEGFGGAHFHLSVRGEGEQVLIGPWSPGSTLAAAVGFGPIMNCSFNRRSNGYWRKWLPGFFRPPFKKRRETGCAMGGFVRVERVAELLMTHGFHDWAVWKHRASYGVAEMFSLHPREGCVPKSRPQTSCLVCRKGAPIEWNGIREGEYGLDSPRDLLKDVATFSGGKWSSSLSDDQLAAVFS